VIIDFLDYSAHFFQLVPQKRIVIHTGTVNADKRPLLGVKAGQ